MKEGESLPQVLKPEKKTSFGTLVFKSALIFVGLALVAVFVSWAFGWVAFESYSSNDLFAKITNGRSEVRRMAATEWARELMMAEQKNDAKQLRSLRPDAGQSSTLLNELQAQRGNSSSSDPVLMGALASILGYSNDSPVAYEGLLKFLANYDTAAAVEPQIYALLSVARLDPTGSESLALFIKASSHPDPSLRKTAAFALGNPAASPDVLLSKQATDRLHELLSDAEEDVRWNAAFALARRKDFSAKPIIAKLLAEAKGTISSELSLERFQAYSVAFHAAQSLGDVELLAQLKEISLTHPNLKLRQAAKKEVNE